MRPHVFAALWLVAGVAMATGVSNGVQASARRGAHPGPAAAEGGKSGVRHMLNRGSFGEEARLLHSVIHNAKLAADLGLTDAQLAAIEEHLSNAKSAFMALQQSMEEAALEQARLMSQDEIDEAALMAAIDRTFDVRKQIAKLRIRQLLLLKQTLSTEQVMKARQVMRRRMMSEGQGAKWRDRPAAGERAKWIRDRRAKGDAAAQNPDPPAGSGGD